MWKLIALAGVFTLAVNVGVVAAGPTVTHGTVTAGTPTRVLPGL